MHDGAAAVLGAWANFYVITGSSAATLTGLMFVVMTLAAAARSQTTSGDGVSTFSTPTVVHFCVALLLSVILSAPWRSLVHAAVLLGLTGLFGVGYIAYIISRTRRLTAYRPQWEDWVWYTYLPLVAYLVTVAAAIGLPSSPVEALFALAGATMLLIIVGIRNSWDVVTYLAIEISPDADAEPAASGTQPPPSA